MFRQTACRRALRGKERSLPVEKNVASNPDYPEINQEFSRRLMADLKGARELRIAGS